MLKKLSMFGALVVLMSSASALAQTATGVGIAGAGNGGIVEIDVRGTVVSSVSLNVTGAPGTVLSGTSSATSPTAAVGTLDFGSFSTQTPSAANNTTFAGRTAANTGAIVAGSLTATLTYSGALTGSITVQRKTIPVVGTSDIQAGNLRVASPALASWTAATDGTAVGNPGTTTDICSGSCTSGTGYTHQLAVYIPDTQAFGLFTSVVTYTGTAL